MVIPPHLDVFLPAPDNIVGPGAQIEVNYNVAGPQPTGTYWDIRCLAPPVEVPIWQQHEPYTANVQPIMLGNSLSTAVQNTLQSAVPEGTSINVDVNLVSGSGGQVVINGNVPAKWSPTTGLGIQQLVTQTTAVLNPSQSEQLQVAAESSVVVLPQITWPAVPEIPLWQWLSKLHHHGLYVRGDQHLISGDGAIPLNGVGESEAFGVLWSFITVPAGFGRIHGILPRYDRRIVELGTVVLDRGLDSYVSETRDINQDGGQWIWDDVLPEQLLYSVTPGCQVLITCFKFFLP